MSRAYRIRVAESERRYITVDDGVCTDIELLPILPQERLATLLGEELEERGFTVADGEAKRTDGDVDITVDLATGRVSARIAGGVEVEESSEGSVLSELRDGEPERVEQMRKKLRAEIDDKIEARRAELQQEVTDKLEAKLRDLQQEVDQVSNRVAGTALKEKAAQLGDIVELHEAENGEVTIKVKV